MSVKRGLAWGYAERWGNKLISLAIFVLLTRLLEPSHIGLVAFAKVFIDYLDMLGAQGLSIAIIQRYQVESRHLNTAFWINIISGLCLSLALVLSSPYIEELFSIPNLADIIGALSIVIIINSLSRVQVAILTRSQKFSHLALRGFLSTIFGGGIGVYLAISGFGVWSLIFQQITAEIIGLIVLWILSPWRPAFRFDLVSAKEIYVFASKVAVEAQVLFFSKRMDEMLIATLLGTTMLGYYGVAKRIFMVLVELFYSVLSGVLVTVMSRIQNNHILVFDMAKRVSMYVGVVAFPVFLSGVVMHKEIINLFFGATWSLSAIPFAILMASGIFMLAPNVLHPFFYSIGRPDIPLKLNLIRSLVYFVALYAGSNYGVIGVAVCVLFVNFLGAVLDYLYMSQFVPSGVIFDNVRIQFVLFMYCAPMVIALAVINILFSNSTDLIRILIAYLVIIPGIYIATLILFKATAIFELKNIIINGFRRK